MPDVLDEYIADVDVDFAGEGVVDGVEGRPVLR